MKLYALLVFYKQGTNNVLLLKAAHELSTFSYFQRSSVQVISTFFFIYNLLKGIYRLYRQTCCRTQCTAESNIGERTRILLSLLCAHRWSMRRCRIGCRISTTCRVYNAYEGVRRFCWQSTHNTMGLLIRENVLVIIVVIIEFNKTRSRYYVRRFASTSR